MKANAFLLHFSDSILPVGSYAHSFGLEGLVQDGVVNNIEELALFLTRDVWHSLLYVDLPLASKAFEFIKKGKVNELKNLDQTARALRPTAQLRIASARIGKQTFTLYQQTWQHSSSPINKTHFCGFQSPVVIGAIFADQGVKLDECLTTITYQCYSTLLQASLKILPTGPSSIQQLLFKCMQQAETEMHKVLTIKEDQWGSFLPVWDIAASKHERATERLFIS